jgi:hypothetical protein
VPSPSTRCFIAAECALLAPAAAPNRDAGRLLRESAMLFWIVVVILVLALMVGLNGRFGGYGFGAGHSGMGLIGVILVVLLVLKLLHKI